MSIALTRRLRLSAIFVVAALTLTMCSRGAAPTPDLDGWIPVSSGTAVDEMFSVEDGVVSTTGAPLGYLRTPEMYSNFEMTLEWKYERPDDLTTDADFTGNSGYLLFIQEDRVWPTSVEVQGMWRLAGDIFLIGTQANISTDGASSESSQRPVGDWNTLRIRSLDGVVEVWVNGEMTSTVSGFEVQNGFIGLQSEGAAISWREIDIRPLEPT